jgi:hypothetical protein
LRADVSLGGHLFVTRSLILLAANQCGSAKLHGESVSVATRSSSFASVVLVAVVGACTSSHHDTVCPRNQPAFRIQVTASDGPLPADTVLVVTYSGTQMESYSLAHGGVDNQDVCCRPGSPTNGALPDVPCGIPPVVTREASVTTAKRDAGAIRDATVVHADAASITDAASSSPITVSLDASSAADAKPRLDASVEDGATALPHASGPEAILCDLWTNGVATVKVTASGYAKANALLDDPFVPDPRCGVETVDHRLVLTHGDGGLLK